MLLRPLLARYSPQRLATEFRRRYGNSPREFRAEALAWIRLRPLGARPPLPGLYLAPWSIGFLPMPGAGSLALCDRLLGLPVQDREPL